MKLVCTHEFPFLGGFISYLSDALESLHRDYNAELQMLRIDEAEMEIAEGVLAGVMVALEVSSGDSGSLLARSVVVELSEQVTERKQYGIRLTMYAAVGAAEDPLLEQERVYEDVFVCRSDLNNGIEVGQVIATAVFEFMRDKRTPESHEFLQGVLDACEEEY